MTNPHRRPRSPQPAAPWVADGKGVTRRFEHPSGWVVQHCGHPTALHPWAVYSPDGFLHRHGCVGKGRAFVQLLDAIAHAEAHIADGSTLSEARLEQLFQASFRTTGAC
jgi:hypothetical protein